MTRNYQVYLRDILEAIDRIESYIRDLTLDDFSKNRIVIDAVIRNFEIIGEATRHIPENIKRKHPEVPWKTMVGMRDKLIHDYFGVVINVLWLTAKDDLTALKPKIEIILKELDDTSL